MPFVMGCCGFGGRSTSRDRITVVSGTPVYDTGVLPPDSASSTSLRGSGIQVRIPWYDDTTSGRNQPTGQFWFHGRLSDSTNNTANDGLRFGVGRNGTELFTISAEDNTYRWTIRVVGQLRATATSAALSVGNWSRLHLHVSGYAEGDTVRVYADGNISSPVVSYTLTSDDESNLGGAGLYPNEFWFYVPTGHGACYADDLIAFDPTVAGAPAMARLIEPSVKEMVPTGNGDEQEWGGSYTDIDERPGSDTDKITATSVGQESNFTFGAVGEDNVFAAKLMARVTRTGTDAGSNLLLIEREGGSEDSVQVAAPGDGDVYHLFQTAPDGTDWSPVSFDASRFGFVSVT